MAFCYLILIMLLTIAGGLAGTLVAGDGEAGGGDRKRAAVAST